METKEKKKEKKNNELTKEELIEQQTQEIHELKHKYLMVHADMENMRKQYDKEYSNIIKYRASGFVDSLMPILDGFYHALKIEVSDEKVKNYLIGFQYIYSQMLAALEQEGISKVEPKVGDKYDIDSMHALEAEESDEIPANHIVKVLSCGYRLKDRLIRPAMVTVAKLKSVKTTEEVQEEPVVKENLN